MKRHNENSTLLGKTRLGRPRPAGDPEGGDDSASQEILRERLAQCGGRNEEAIVELLCDDQVERWHAGQRIPAEAYLALHPALGGEPESSFELIYGEYVLRESMGEAPTLAEFLWRFPRFAERLRRQIALHQALGSAPAAANGSPAPDDAAEAPGPVVPGYRILGELGHGGMGVVYKARQLSLNRLVALKVIRPGAYARPELGVRFRAEAEVVARFQHPNIIQVYEVGEHDGLAYLALEYAAGGSLHETLAGKPREAREAAELVEVLARVVHYAHLRGIVHRDLKPANVVLTEEGVPKVTDFGLAKLLEHDGSSSQTEAILGTPSYMAPEQFSGGSREITPAADVYSLGAILYEILTGRPPFTGSTPLSTLEQVATQDPLPPSSLQRHLPRDLEVICLKCLEKDPGRRYATAQGLADDLRSFLDGRPIQARPTSLARRAWKWARRRPSTATALVSIAAAVVVLFAGALYYNTRLRAAVHQARSAEAQAESSAVSAVEQRNLALKALNKLVFEVQEKLGNSPRTRSLRRSLLGTAIAGLDEIARSAESAVPDLSRAVAHQKLGEIFRQVGRAQDARRQLDLSRRLAEVLAARDPRDIAIAECLERTHMGLGELSLREKATLETRQHFQRAVMLSRMIYAAEPGREGARRGLIEAYLELGRAFGFAGELAQAEVWFHRTHDLAERWTLDEPDNSEAGEMLAWSYRKLADMRKLSADYPAARAYYLKAIELGRRLAKAEPGSLEFKSHLGVALHDLARLTSRRRMYAEARPLFQEAERVFTEVVAADAESLESQLWLVRAETDFARLERAESRFPEALGLYRRARERLDELRREDRLPGLSAPDAKLIGSLGREIAACEAAAVALGELNEIQSHPARQSSRLLLTRAQVMMARRCQAEVIAAADALCRLEPGDRDEAEDTFDLAVCLIECIDCLSDDLWPEDQKPARAALRDHCADRAVAVLDLATRHGFDEVQRLEGNDTMARLRGHPGFRALIERLKASKAPRNGREDVSG